MQCNMKMASAPLSLVTAKIWRTFFDQDGRLVNEMELIRLVFRYGVEDSIRSEVWKFLCGLYPANSTSRERHAMAIENRARYFALKNRWRILDATVVSDYIPSHHLFYLEEEDGEKYDDVIDEQGKAPYDSLEPDNSPDDEALVKMLDITAKLYATQQDVSLEKYLPAKRVILKDVVRTDRYHPYFKKNENLRKVHHILLVYAMFNPAVGYLQGYNDILARFLVVLDSEVDCYWMFGLFVQKREKDFSEEGMIHKIELVSSLLREVDLKLFKFFADGPCSDFLFCHRWLLLNFKREFSMEDGVRIFEILSSEYLELSSDVAMKAHHKAIAVEFLSEGGELEVESMSLNHEYTFEIFMCVAVLKKYEKELLQKDGVIEIIGYINGLAHKMAVKDIIEEAQKLVFRYCKLAVQRGYSLLPQS